MTIKEVREIDYHLYESNRSLIGETILDAKKAILKRLENFIDIEVKEMTRNGTPYKLLIVTFKDYDLKLGDDL